MASKPRKHPADGMRRISTLDDRGHELMDQSRVAMPAGFKEPESMEQMMRRLIRQPDFGRVISGDEDAETFADADDFDVPDDPADPSSVFEENFDPGLGRSVTAAEVMANRERFAEETNQRVARRRARTAPPAGDPAAPTGQASPDTSQPKGGSETA